MAVRGKIENEARALQSQYLRDYSGLNYPGVNGMGRITPTDIDGTIEYHDKCYVFWDLKCPNEKISYGQQLAFERLCDDLQKVKPTIYIIATHNTNSNAQIDAANAIVEKFRMNSQWLCGNGFTLKKLIDLFLQLNG